jgi:membrane protease YdiL (CAAX protease family)
VRDRRPPALIWRSGIAPWAALALMAALAAAFGVMRFIGLLGPAPTRWMLPLSFTLMMAAPWLLLDAAGRRQIGLRRPAAPWMYAVAVLLGMLAALLCSAIGMLLFAHGADNWFVSVASSYRGNMDTSRMSLASLYLIFTIPALLFSPIGEEIFFRGMLQWALEQHCSARVATTIESAAFGLVHLCHHGLLLDAAGLHLRPLSAALWVILMFFTAVLFAAIRKRSGSLLPAMAAHAAFNAAMNAVIFSFLW